MKYLSKTWTVSRARVKKAVIIFGAALVYTGLGGKDEALRSLERAIELRAPLVTLLKVDPRFDTLRPDPRFQNLLRRMNLPE